MSREAASPAYALALLFKRLAANCWNSAVMSRLRVTITTTLSKERRASPQVPTHDRRRRDTPEWPLDSP